MIHWLLCLCLWFVFYRWFYVCFQNLVEFHWLHSSPTCETQHQSLMDTPPCFIVEQVFFFTKTPQPEFCLTFACPQDPFSNAEAYRDAMKFASSPQKVLVNITITAESAKSSWGSFVGSDFYVDLHSFPNHILTWGTADPHTWLSSHSFLPLSGWTHSC